MKPRPEKRLYDWAWVAAAVLVALLLRLSFMSTLTGYDEFAYARIAGDIVDGTFALERVSGYYGFRYLVTFPAALFHKLLGGGSQSVVAWPLLCSLGNTMLAYFLGRELFGRGAGILAAFFQAFLPMSVIYGTMLYPEEILVFWTGLSALLFLWGTAKTGRWGGAGMFALAGLCAGLGWHTRLNSAVMLLVFFAWALRRGVRPAYLAFAAGFFCTLVPDWIAGAALAGDPFFSLRSQLAKLAADTAVYPEGHAIYLRGLLGLDLYGLALFGIYFYFFAAAAGVAVYRRELGRMWVPLAWFSLLLLYFEFGPARLSPYHPVHKQLRFLSMGFFPVLVVAAQFIAGLRPALRAAAVTLLLGTSAAAAWKMNAYRAAEAAPHREVAAYLAGRSPSAVYAVDDWANSLGYYLRPGRKIPYYAQAGGEGGFIRSPEEALPAGPFPGSCLVADLSAGGGLPPGLLRYKKDSLEIPGRAGVYCFK